MKNRNINYHILIFPLCIIVVIAGLVTTFPDGAAVVINNLFDIFGNRFGAFYILMGLFTLVGSVVVAASKYGTIKLGNIDRPVYGNFKWGAMIFTSTMAADILYWSLIEWVYYYQANPTGLIELSAAQRQQIASTYPLFHWGPIPWSFYILPAAAYAYMFFVKNRNRQTLSEACRPLLNKKVDGFLGKLIDTVAVVGLLGGTATTFALATPLIAGAINKVLGFTLGKGLAIVILLFVGVIFTAAVFWGMKFIARLALINVGLFTALLLFVFFLGPTRFIVESGISGVGNMINNFITMSTWTDPLRVTGDGVSGFPQQWTIFYWAYWIAWFVATPFFIAKISEGRTIRQMIFGAFFYGIAGTFTSFIVFGNFGLYQQVTGKVDTTALLEEGVAPSDIILRLFDQLPLTQVVLALLAITMIAFYASTFDAITLVVAGFCRKTLKQDEQPEKYLRVFWALVFIILPISLIWSESTLGMLQTISILVAFPLSVIILLIVFSFIKEMKTHKEK
ncbi:carnitine transporter [Spirochaetia bacterium]|nr:carnitine transporter [Spirochaetia bacterium]